jgi:hypothetical protein
MIGRLFINELTNNDALIDLSMWPSRILDERNPYGFAFKKTVQHLGMSRRDIDHRSSILSGSTEFILTNTDILRAHIGMIARIGADRAEFYKAFVENDISRSLANITDKFLPIVTSEVEFSEVVELITAPFADAANKSGEAFRITHGQQPYWIVDDPESATRRQLLMDEYASKLVSERQ